MTVTATTSNFNTPLTLVDRYSTWEINKETGHNATLEQMDLMAIFGTFHPKEVEYAFFSSAHGAFSRIDQMSSHKTSLNKFKVEIIASMFSEHNDVKQEINYKKQTEKTHKHTEAK